MKKTGLLIILLFICVAPVKAQEIGTYQNKDENIQGSLFEYLGYMDELDSLKLFPEQVDELPTLFFTKWQHALLQEAREGYTTRPPDATDESGTIVRGPREISLGGIVYSSDDKWVVWLNKQRVTPDALPREVMDLKVSTDYVELKWYDSYTNQIFPIRLRAHQRFNIDSKIFLPGTGVN
jgi:hypothetical protein